MGYRAIADFNDLMDGGHAYQAGDEYPRPGHTPGEGRIRELSTHENRRGEPVIAEYKDFGEAPAKEAPRKKGGRKNA